MKGKLQGKVALVVGASKEGNIGQGIAKLFSLEGAEVVASGRDTRGLKAFSQTTGISVLRCDIQKIRQIEHLVETVIEKYGRLDIVVQAAGSGLNKPFLEVTQAELKEMTDTQFIGPFRLLQMCIPAMSYGGSIIQISSAAATVMLENYAPYMATKAGIDHLIRVIANEFGHLGLKANSISPGLTPTPMTKDAISIPGLREAFEKQSPLGRLSTVDDIAQCALFLASDDCFISGENLQVNGGLRLRGFPTAEEINESMLLAKLR
ncbi:SDR family oxidoreductase [Shewanella corallii]|uniref:SDR family oxidoreductase n=1 Tax=Shewanella corallii TaxID=560080 RepID=A0ABT0NCH7_9GAMM|nr:SDR family oxidoreductase [Shewanella corallii]MCL2915511.1 SDR family oxidoreductase [Shewanella corallii]